MGQKNFFDIKYLLYNMDTGYWFLISLFIITIIFGLSSFLSEKLAKKRMARIILFLVFFLVSVCIIFSIGLIVGMDFCNIKLTLYYTPFFIAGWFYGQFDEAILNRKNGKNFLEIVVAISLMIYILLMWRTNVSELGDSIREIVMRLIISTVGCIAFCGLIGNFPLRDNHSCNTLLFFGKHSLEIYLLHYIFLSLVKFDIIMQANTLVGTMTWIFAYICIIILTITTILMLNHKVLRKILFWK